MKILKKYSIIYSYNFVTYVLNELCDNFKNLSSMFDQFPMTAEGGELRVYLEGLANTKDMHKYVEEHPFGQEGITERSKFWNFYCEVINSLSTDQSNF